eukprot:3010020-Amphidinium_carterae.1
MQITEMRSESFSTCLDAKTAEWREHTDSYREELAPPTPNQFRAWRGWPPLATIDNTANDATDAASTRVPGAHDDGTCINDDTTYHEQAAEEPT